MFAPMRPRPLNPSCMDPSLLSVDGKRDRALERGKVRVGSEMDVDDGPIMRPNRLSITAGLGVDQLADRIRPARNGPVHGMVARELEEPAGRRSALVELAGSVGDELAV